MKNFLLIAFAFALICSFNLIDGGAKKMDAISKLTYKEKISQMMMVGVSGKSINSYTKKMIRTYKPGGILLFGYNIAKKKRFKRFLSSMQKYSLQVNSIPMFISLDQEGGRVKRIVDGATQFPGNMATGSANDTDLTEKAAEVLAIQLKELGVNMNLAPDVDVNNNPFNPVINTRSYGSDAELVADHGVAYIKGLQKQGGVIAVVKHFPGHGDTSKDSHHVVPVINYDLDRLKRVEFLPFERAIDYGVEGVMSAHISFPKVLKNNKPATLSKKFLTDILRKDMDFKGLVFTDDLEMNAIDGKADIGDAAVESVLAGVDIMLISTHGDNIRKIYSAMVKAYENGILTEERLNRSFNKIIELKKKYKIITSNEKGEILQPSYTLTEDDREFLKGADEINRKLSEKALYYHSNGRETDLKLSENNIIISDNTVFIKKIKGLKNKSIKVFREKKLSLKKIRKFAKKKSGSKIYYLSYKHNQKVIKALEGIKNTEIILISTGNPFLVSTVKDMPAILFTFSNTAASFDAVIKTLQGEYNPKRSIKLKMTENSDK